MKFQFVFLLQFKFTILNPSNELNLSVIKEQVDSNKGFAFCSVNNAGKIQALNWIRTLPNDDMDISANSILRVMPMKVRIQFKA